MKVTKQSVQYSVGMKTSHCGICKYYTGNRCTRVEGSIKPNMWCKLFKKVTK